MLKQMKLIYAQGFSKNEKLEWKPVIFANIVQSFRLILDAMNEMDISFENPENEVSGWPAPPCLPESPIANAPPRPSPHLSVPSRDMRRVLRPRKFDSEETKTRSKNAKTAKKVS